MTTPVSSIPGFYYDPEKKKYFKLLPHHAAPAGSFYSSTRVKQAEAEKKLKEKEELEAARRLEQRRRSPLYSSPRNKITLFHQLGTVSTTTDRREALRQVYAGKLERYHLHDVDPNRLITAFVPDFAPCPEHASLIVGTSSGDVSRVPLVDSDEGPLVTDMRRATALIYSWARVTSMCISVNRLLLTTLHGGLAYPTMYFTALFDDTDDAASRQHRQPLQIQTTVGRRTMSLWTSSASPHRSGGFLVGSSGSVLHIRENPTDMQETHYWTGTDVFAVEYVPHTPHVFVCGARDGVMRTYDIRTRTGVWPGESVRANILVQCRSAITHIRMMTEQTVLINGLSGCNMYDLRFPHPSSPSIDFTRPTRPAIEYPELSRKDGYMLDLGFDVNREHGVMAVANQENTIQLYSTDTGEKLRSQIGSEKLEQPCKGLRFAGSDAVPERLFAVNGGELNYYSV